MFNVKHDLAKMFLNQAHMAKGWFLEIALVCTSVRVSVCVSALEGINNQWHDIGHVQLVKQISWCFPALNYFICLPPKAKSD